MAKRSAGLSMYRKRGGKIEVLLVHPGGPFWAKKDAGAWSIPKGEYIEEENALEAAKREFKEETGFTAARDFKMLKPVVQPGGKEITAWAFEGDCDPAKCKSNTFLMEWPPYSGNQQEFPEVDRAEWFTLDEAKKKILKGQIPLLEELEQLIKL
jgi:predicted NUDIX family NTP pyrophosphohydrolase